MKSSLASIGLLLLIIFEVNISAQLIKDGNIVRDTSNNLEWQDNEIKGPMLWEDAIYMCGILQLNSDGSDVNEDGWRLPNINELKSIMDDTKTKPVFSSAFENVKTTDASKYWSSTTNHRSTYDRQYAWYIDFYESKIISDGDKNSTSYYALCIRDKL